MALYYIISYKDLLEVLLFYVTGVKNHSYHLSIFLNSLQKLSDVKTSDWLIITSSVAQC